MEFRPFNLVARMKRNAGETPDIPVVLYDLPAFGCFGNTTAKTVLEFFGNYLADHPDVFPGYSIACSEYKGPRTLEYTSKNGIRVVMHPPLGGVWLPYSRLQRDQDKLIIAFLMGWD